MTLDFSSVVAESDSHKNKRSEHIVKSMKFCETDQEICHAIDEMFHGRQLLADCAANMMADCMKKLYEYQEHGLGSILI